MSDGISDAYRVNRDENDLIRYLESIANFLQKAPALVKLAEIEADDDVKLPGASAVVRAGRECGHNDQGIHRLLRLLMREDREAWGRLLARGMRLSHSTVDRLRSLSPLKDCNLTVMDYGLGFCRMGGDLELELSEAISSRGLCTYDCDEYVVVVEMKVKDVIWLGSGASHGDAYNTPIASERKARKARLKKK